MSLIVHSYELQSMSDRHISYESSSFPSLTILMHTVLQKTRFAFVFFFLEHSLFLFCPFKKN